MDEPRTPPTLRGEGLTVGYSRGAPVLRGQSARLAPGQITALVGPNGSGKSTLLKTLGGHLAPEVGRVLLRGEDIAALSTRALAQQLGILFQRNDAPAGLTVEALVQHGRHPHRRMFEDLTSADREAIEHALELTGTAPLRKRRLNTLSGGQRQLAWLALALAQEPQVLLLDEPTTSLDLRHQIDVMETIVALRDTRGTTIAMVLHDINQAARYADHLMLLRQGEIVARGAPRDIITVERLRAVFDVEVELLTTSDGFLVCAPTGASPPP